MTDHTRRWLDLRAQLDGELLFLARSYIWLTDFNECRGLCQDLGRGIGTEVLPVGQLEVLLGNPNGVLPVMAILLAEGWWTIRVLPEYALHSGDRFSLTRAGGYGIPCHGGFPPGPAICHCAGALLSVLTSHQGFGYPVPAAASFGLCPDF